MIRNGFEDCCGLKNPCITRLCVQNIGANTREKILDVYFQDGGQLPEASSRNAVQTLFVFLNLLERQSNTFSYIFLRIPTCQSEYPKPLANPTIDLG